MEKTILRGTKILYGEHVIRLRVIYSNSDFCPVPFYITTLQNDTDTPIAVTYSVREYKAIHHYCSTLTDIFCDKYDTVVKMIHKLKARKKCCLEAIEDLGCSDLYKLDDIFVDPIEPDRATVDTISVDTVSVDTIEPDRVSVDGTTEGKIYCRLLTDTIPEENYTNCDNENSFSELCYQIY